MLALELILLGVAAACLLTNLGSGSLFNHDDAIYGRLIKDMHAHDGSIFELLGWRPPLYYTLVYLSTSVLGVNELGLRMVAALSGIMVLVATYLAGARLLEDRRAGLVAATALFASFLFYLFARRVRGLDITLMLFIELAVMYGLVAMEKERRAHWLTAGLFTGLAVLTKSVVGLFPLGVLGAAVLVRRRWDLLRAWQVYAGVGVAAAVAGIWPLLSTLHERPSAFASHLTFHLIRRASDNILKPQDDAFYYFKVLWEFEGALGVVMLLAVPLALALAVRRRHGNAAALGIWAAVVFAAFSLARTRLEHYILPAYPAACLLAGWLASRALDRAAARAGSHGRAIQMGGVILICVALLGHWGRQNLRLLVDLDHSSEEKELALAVKRSLPGEGRLYLLNLYWPVFDYYSGHDAVSLTTSRNAYAIFCKVPSLCEGGKARFIEQGGFPKELLAGGPVAVVVDTRVTPAPLIRRLAQILRPRARTKYLALYGSPGR